MRRYVAVTVVALLLAACTGNETRDNPGSPQSQADPSDPGKPQVAQADPADAPEAEQANQAISEAEAAAEKADAVGYLWRDTEGMIEEARKAAEAQEYQKAIELANEARRQSEAAYRQYLDQRDAAARE